MVTTGRLAAESGTVRNTQEPGAPSRCKTVKTHRAQIVKEKGPEVSPAGTGIDPKVTAPKYSDTNIKSIRADLGGFEVEYKGDRKTDGRTDYADERHMKSIARMVLKELAEGHW